MFSDKKWHTPQDLMRNSSWRFGSTIQCVRKLGYDIILRRIPNSPAYEYRWTGLNVPYSPGGTWKDRARRAERILRHLIKRGNWDSDSFEAAEAALEFADKDDRRHK